MVSQTLIEVKIPTTRINKLNLIYMIFLSNIIVIRKRVHLT